MALRASIRVLRREWMAHSPARWWPLAYFLHPLGLVWHSVSREEWHLLGAAVSPAVFVAFVFCATTALLGRLMRAQREPMRDEARSAGIAGLTLSQIGLLCLLHNHFFVPLLLAGATHAPLETTMLTPIGMPDGSGVFVLMTGGILLTACVWMMTQRGDAPETGPYGLAPDSTPPFAPRGGGGQDEGEGAGWASRLPPMLPTRSAHAEREHESAVR